MFFKGLFKNSRRFRYFIYTSFLIFFLYTTSYYQNYLVVFLHFSRNWFAILRSGKSLTEVAREFASEAKENQPKPVPFFIHRATAASVSCTMSAPPGGTTVSGPTTVSATAEVTGGNVQFKLDGGNLGSPDTSSPYSISWDTTSTSNGSHTLSCTATNDWNHTGTSPSISVTVNNDVTPPVRSNGAPSSILPSGTTSTSISLTTNENATCKYSVSSGTAYSSMSNTFSTTGATSHSSTVSGLSDGNSYTYYVRCQDAASNPNTNDYSISFSVANPSGDTEDPSVPGNVVAVVSSAAEINITWNASTDNVGVAGYKIFRDGVEIATTASTSYTDSGLTPSTAYSYEVSAYDAAANESAHSTPDSATTLADSENPTVPGSVSASAASSTEIRITWNASTDNVGIAGYKIFRGGIQIGTTSGTSYTDSGLTPSTSYNYEVSAYDLGNNESALSTLVSATTEETPAEVQRWEEQKVEIVKARRAIKASPKYVQRWTLLTQSGKRFSKNAVVMLYFERPYGKGYYSPTYVKTDSKGRFSITYFVTKPAGQYRWYAIEPMTGRKSKRITYTVYNSKDSAYYEKLRKSSSSSGGSTRAS